MALKGKGFDNNNTTRKLAKEQRKVHIAQDKQRARFWAENRRLRRVPLVVAHEVSELRTEVSIQERACQQSVQQVTMDSLIIFQNLESRRQLLLQEAEEIQSAIQVIKRTLSYESHLQEPTGASCLAELDPWVK